MSLCSDMFALIIEGNSVKEIVAGFEKAGYSKKKIKKTFLAAIEQWYGQSMTDLRERKASGSIKEGAFVAEFNAIEKRRTKLIDDLAKELPE